MQRVHRRSITVVPGRGQVTDQPEHAIPRPALGVRLVCVWWPAGVDASTKPARWTGVAIGEPPPARHIVERGFVEADFELAHDVCPGNEPWRAELRGAPGDDELRAVYADWLEQRAEHARADFVRTVIRWRASTGQIAKQLAQQLQQARQGLPGSWCRDVARCAQPRS
jgi:uncharacterized protein (TIGR02996 family)